MKYENLNLNGLFYSIDDIENSFEENDTIFSYINTFFKKKIKKYYNDYLKMKDKRKMLKRYRNYLTELSHIVNLQIKQIDNLLDDEFDCDFEDTYSKMKSDLMNICMYQVDLDLSDINFVMEDDNEKRIYCCNRFYKSITDYYIHPKSKRKKYLLKISTENNQLRNIQSEFFFITTLYNGVYKDNINLHNHIRYNFPSYTFENYDMNKLPYDKPEILDLYKEYFISRFQANLSKVVYFRRNQMNLTQKQLSELSDVDRTMIAKIEKVNQKTTMETAVKLLTTLNIGITFYPLK